MEASTKSSAATSDMTVTLSLTCPSFTCALTVAGMFTNNSGPVCSDRAKPFAVTVRL